MDARQIEAALIHIEGRLLGFELALAALAVAIGPEARAKLERLRDGADEQMALAPEIVTAMLPLRDQVDELLRLIDRDGLHDAPPVP